MLPSLGGGQFSLGGKLQNLRIKIFSRGYVGCCSFWTEEANDDDEDNDNKFGEDLGCCPVWEEEAGSMRPPAAALANAGPRPHTLLVSHFVEVRPEYRTRTWASQSPSSLSMCSCIVQS